MTNEIDTLDKKFMEYNELKNKSDDLKVKMDLIKEDIKELMKKLDLNVFTSRNGQIKFVEMKRNQFLQTRAKSFLSEEQLKECYQEKTVSFLRILNPMALNSMKNFVKNKNENNI